MLNALQVFFMICYFCILLVSTRRLKTKSNKKAHCFIFLGSHKITTFILLESGDLISVHKPHEKVCVVFWQEFPQPQGLKGMKGFGEDAI
jgi:hypothetical protein